MDNIEINLDTDKGESGSIKQASQKQPAAEIKGKIEPDETKPQSTIDKLDIRKSSHPLICIFHLLFKLFALVAYLTFSWFMNQVAVFILVTLLLCFDFWTVKNVTGRLLVGLRWWTTVDEEGHEKWFFESFDQKVKSNPIDHRIFWWSQMGATGLWAVFFVWRVLTIFQLGFFWTALSFLGLFFTGTNLYAYFKCSKDHNKKLRGMVNNVSSKIVTSALMSKYGMGLFK